MTTATDEVGDEPGYASATESLRSQRSQSGTVKVKDDYLWLGEDYCRTNMSIKVPGVDDQVPIHVTITDRF